MASIGGAYAAALLLLLLRLFAGVTLGASAQPAASSSSRCASLETACHDFWSAAECGVTKNCIPGWERLPAAPAPPGNDTELCAVCKQMVSEARAQLLSNETQSELRQVLQGSCRILLPFEPLQEVCAKIMDSFIDELDDVLVSRMDPDQVCQVSGLCWQSVSSAAAQADLFERVSHLLLARSGTAATAATTPAAVAAANSCAECKDTVDKAVGFIQFVPVDVLVHSFGVACIRSMKDVLKCDEMTYVYAQRFIQSFLLSTSDRTCRAFGKCGDGEAAAAAAAAASYIDRPAVGGPQGEPLECEFCEAMVHRIAVRFNNTAAREQIKTALEIMCQRTGFWARECLERVENNFDKIYDKVINMLEPSVLCSLIGICRPDHTTTSIAPTTPNTTPTTETPSTPTTGTPSTPTTGTPSTPTTETPTMPTTETPSTPTTETPSTATTETPSTPTTETPSASTADTTTTSVTPTTAAERHTMPLMPLTPARWNIAEPVTPCSACKFLANTLEAALNSTSAEEKLTRFLEALCKLVPLVNTTSCLDFVDQSVPVLIERFIERYNADYLCTAVIPVCPKSSETSPLFLLHTPPFQRTSAATAASAAAASAAAAAKGSDVEWSSVPVACSVCEKMVATLATWLNRTDVENRVIWQLDKLCDTPLFKGARRRECHYMVEAYAALLLHTVSYQLNPHTVCAKALFCSGSKPAPAQVKVDSKPCDVCRNTIGFLEHAVKNNASKETVETILSSVCYWYGINATACKEYVQTNIDKLFEMLQKDVDADKICIEMHLCGGNGLATRVSPANSGFCATCKDAVGLVMKELEDDNVKHGVETRLMTICDLAPVNVTQCQNLVFDAVEELFEALRRSISVETVCDKLHLCDQQFKTQGSLVAVGADNVFCKACRSVAEQLVGVINDDDAKDRVEAAIEKICELLPMDVATCQQFIDQKVGEAYAYMRARITVDNICFRGLHVCGGGGGLSVNGRSAVAGRRASCEVCSRMFEWLLDETRRNTSQAAILTAIRRVCMALPDHETAECRTLIGTYSVVFMNLVRDGVSTPEACETLGLCLQAPHASATASPFIAGSASFRSASRLRAREDLCGTCRSVTGWLLGELQNNKTDEAVRDGLRRVCSHVPGEPAADRCQSLVEAYEDPLSSFIEHGMSSDDACHAIGVCEARPPSPSPSPPAASHGNACELCTVVSTWLVGELKDNKTVDAIVFALEKVCTVLPVNKVECQNYIETYSHLLLQLLQEDLTPKEMCDVLGLCESNQLIPLPKAPQSVVCPLCERLISWLVERLGDNRTEQSILGELEKVCVVIPADRVRCENFVQVYGSELASLLATAAPTTVCVSLGVCGFWERPVAVLPMTCPLCTVVVDGIQQQLRSATVTKEEIMHAMENVCTYIPMDRTECQTAVNKYADVIVRLILEDSAQDVCSKMRACPPNAALSLGGYSA